MTDSNESKKVQVEAVTQQRWEEAQKFEREFARLTIADGDDWNEWWQHRFDDYRVLKGRHFDTVAEVACGPHTNIRLILPDIRFHHVVLNDPLIEFYMDPPRPPGIINFFKMLRPTIVKRLVRKYHATTLSEKLEDIPLPDAGVDLCVCINALDHVQDAVRCCEQMKRILKIGGTLVLGQDLSNEEDFLQCPESWDDVGHPIKMSHEFFDRQFASFRPVFSKILPREEGRNPKAHYGTYFLIGEKVHAG